MTSNRNELSPQERAENEAQARRGFAEGLKAMTDAVGDRLMADIVNDNRRSPIAQEPKPKARERGSGWYDAKPLGPQPGINYVDQLCDAADVRDRAERIAQLQAQLKALKGES
jgi:hypothetical protein